VTTYRRCFRAFLERPQQEPLASKDIKKSTFRRTMIAEDTHRDLVTKHFQQYPVLYLDLKVGCIVYMHNPFAKGSKNVQGAT
jgi:hypothetical protein